MAYAEDIVKLRKRVLDAVQAGVIEANLKDFYEATLLQIMNEAERQRQVCVNQAETLRKQASVADGQASAYSALSSIVYNVLNAYIIQAEKALAEEKALEAEKAEKLQYMASLESSETSSVESEDNTEKKKTRKK